jgi:hypothetical protein
MAQKATNPADAGGVGRARIHNQSWRLDIRVCVTSPEKLQVFCKSRHRSVLVDRARFIASHGILESEQ